MKKTGILIAIMLFCQLGFAQVITYSYDLAGNRTGRSYSIEKIITPDSLSMAENNGDATAGVLQTDNSDQLTETLGEKTITVYPNPTEGLLKISITNFDNSKGQIILYAINGSELLKISPLQATNILNISDKTNGTYMMEVWLDGKKTVWKIVKK